VLSLTGLDHSFSKITVQVDPGSSYKVGRRSGSDQRLAVRQGNAGIVPDLLFQPTGLGSWGNLREFKGKELNSGHDGCSKVDFVVYEGMEGKVER